MRQICLYLLGLPPYITAIFRVGFHSHISFQTFVGFLRAPMIFCGLFVIGWWCFWMLGSDDGEDRFWDKQTSVGRGRARAPPPPPPPPLGLVP